MVVTYKNVHNYIIYDLIYTRSTLIFQPESYKQHTKIRTQNTPHKDRKTKYSALRREIKTNNVAL
jgi:hypothetical protein